MSVLISMLSRVKNNILLVTRAEGAFVLFIFVCFRSTSCMVHAYVPTLYISLHIDGQ